MEAMSQSKATSTGYAPYSIDELRDIVSPIARRYDVRRVWLFGSYARGEATPDSDLDFRVDPDETYDYIKYASFFIDLEEALSMRVDLTTTGSMSDEFLSLISDEEIIIYDYKSNINVLRHIVKHCHQIELTRTFMGDTFDLFQSNFIFYNAVITNVTQIGVLANLLSDEFKKSHTEIPWNQIIKLKNIAFHHYEQLDLKLLWQIIIKNTPELKKISQEQLDMLVTQETKKEVTSKQPCPKF